MRYPSRHVVMALTVGVCFPTLSRAQAADAFSALVNHMHRSWTMADGLPGMVESIAQTPDGYLWLGTQHGIVRFDGERMTIFNSGAEFGLKTERITALLVDHRGNLWAGTYGGGLAQIVRGRTVRTYSTVDGLTSDFITALFEDHRGRLWIGQKDGSVSELWAERIQHTSRHQSPGPPNSVKSVFEDSHGHILAAYQTGLLGLEPAESPPCVFLNSPKPVGAISLLGDGEGGLWVGTRTGLYRCRHEHIIKVWPANASRDISVWSLAKDNKGNLWLGSDSGVLRLQNGVFESFREKDGLSADVVRKVFIDTSGNVWAGTLGGLDRFSERMIASYSTKQGLSSNQVWSVVEDRRGEIWVGTNGGLDRIKGSKIQQMQGKALPSSSVYSTQEAPDGDMWFATPAGLCRLRGEHLSVYGRKNGLPDGSVNAIIWTRNGTMLVSPRQGGLFTFINGKFRPYIQLAETVHSISEARDGSLWLSTAGALLHLQGDRVVAYGEASDDYASSLEDGHGRVWAGSWQRGLVCIKGDQFVRFDSLGHPFDDHIFHIFEDGKQQLWLSTPHGLFRVSEADLNNYMQGNQKHVYAAQFGIEDGFPSTGCNGSEQNSGWMDRKGRFWIPTGKGLALVDPRSVEPDTTPPNAIVEQVLVDDRAIAPTGKINLPAGSKRIVFTYTGISLTAPHAVHFRYRLEGFDQDWMDGGINRAVSYTGLNPGAYNFRVTAGNRFGIWQEAAGVQLRVTEPFYRANWFFVTCSFALACSCIGAYRWRIREIGARSQAALMERMRMAREIHDTLLQGVTGASLVLEAIASSVADTEVRQRFDRALDEMQLAMSETRCALWNMRDTDAQTSSLAARLSRYGKSISEVVGSQFGLDLQGTPVALDPDRDREVYHIGREAILNAIRHSGAPNVGVTVDFQADHLSLTITDNGCGFDVANATTSGHWGLLGMRERAAASGGSCSVSSAPREGTRVVVKLPYAGRPRRGTPKTRAIRNWKLGEIEPSHGHTDTDSNPLRR
jgi:signal transduction histidine kinase/ligand-binding sensor domain-containing protein